MNKFYYVLLILGLLLSFILGYKTRKCPTIVSTVHTVDTTYQDYPIHDTVKLSAPLVIKWKPAKQILVTKTDTVFLDYPEWETSDTLAYEGIRVNLKDRGNCSGIIERTHKFSGTLKERIITKTELQTVKDPAPLLTLYAGASASFSNKWKAFDIGPAIGISLKQKHLINYSYGLNTSTHEITLMTAVW